MTCCNHNNKTAYKRLTLEFIRAQLLYDIANYAWVEADGMPAQDPHAPHPTADITQDGNIDRVTRVLNLAYEECRDMLYPYTKREMECGTHTDDTLREPASYIIELRVPETFSDTTARYLQELLHEYMVCRVLEDWLSITSPGARDRWAVKLAGITEKATTCLNTRMGRTRRTLTPF